MTEKTDSSGSFGGDGEEGLFLGQNGHVWSLAIVTVARHPGPFNAGKVIDMLRLAYLEPWPHSDMTNQLIDQWARTKNVLPGVGELGNERGRYGDVFRRKRRERSGTT